MQCLVRAALGMLGRGSYVHHCSLLLVSPSLLVPSQRLASLFNVRDRCKATVVRKTDRSNSAEYYSKWVGVLHADGTGSIQPNPFKLEEGVVSEQDGANMEARGDNFGHLFGFRKQRI